MANNHKEKEEKRDFFGEDRANTSCNRVVSMLEKRPWTYNKVKRTRRNSIDDSRGVDVFCSVDQRLVDILCMESDSQGIKIQVKSGIANENEFYSGVHRKRVLNLATGENIFVLNGQEPYPVMMASLVGQMVAMASLTGISEDIILDFLANEMRDEEIVEAYIDNREQIVREKWFGEWLDGSRIRAWDELMPELLILES